MTRSVVLIMLTLLLATNELYAQEVLPPTNSTDVDAKFNKKKERPKGKRHYMTIIKTDTKNILYGNKCFEDFTRQLGFVYEVQIKGRPGSMNGFTRFWHNTGTKTALFFTATPWWKLRVNKRRDECRTSSGDFVG